MRLNQFISSSGFCSRRQADILIKEQKVTVNGKVIKLGHMINAGDRVEVEGQVIEAKENNIYMMLNKPPGITCTAAPHIEGNIIGFINYPERIFPVGRLDKQSEGLILLTNDGSFVNDLLQSESNQEKEYIVTVDKEITQSFIENMGNGVKIYNPRKKENMITKQCKVLQINNYEFRIVLSQGLNRQIRRMCRRFQYTVTKLQRVRMKHLSLDQLELGQWRYLTDDEIMGLRKEPQKQIESGDFMNVKILLNGALINAIHFKNTIIHTDSKKALNKISFNFYVTSKEYHDITVLLYENDFLVEIAEKNLSFKATIMNYSTSITDLYKEGETGLFHLELVEKL